MWSGDGESASKRPGRVPESADVVIVGGGLAGLAAGVSLSESQSVLVLEAQSHLGGRAASWIDPTTGDPVHIGPHVFLSTYRNFPQLLELVDAPGSIVWQRDQFITLVEGAKQMRIALSGWPAPFHLLRDSLAKWGVKTRDLLTNTPLTLFALQATEEDILRLDAIDARAFLRSMGCSNESVEEHWSFICLAIMNVPLHRCSAGSLMRFYRDLMSHGDICFGFPDRGLGDLFAPACKRTIEGRGGRVLTGKRVVRFLGEEDAVSGVALDDGSTVRAERVISTLPPQRLRSLIPRAWRSLDQVLTRLDSFEPCPYVSTYLWFDRKLTDLKFWARTYDPTDLNCDFYDLSNINAGFEQRPSIIASNIIYSHRANDLSDDAIVRETLRELCEFLPEAGAPGALRNSVVHRIPMGIHCPVPGTEAIRPDQRTSVKGLYLAGDWTRTEMPACMEGAVKSGFMVAEDVLTDSGLVPNVRALPWGSGLTSMSTMFARFARLATRVQRPLFQLGL